MEIETLDNLVTRIAGMDRLDLVSLLRDMHCTFPMDFSDEYFQTISVDRLRHIALAASLHRLQAA